MTKTKSLVSIIIFLLLTNLAMLFFFIVLDKPVQKNGKDQNGGMLNMLQKDVGFSKEQLDSFQSLKKSQFEKIHPLFDEVKKTKMDFYNLVYDPQVSDSTISVAADSIAATEKLLDVKLLIHFKSLRGICTPDQLQKFDTTIKKVFIRMTERLGRDRHSH